MLGNQGTVAHGEQHEKACGGRLGMRAYQVAIVKVILQA